MTSLPEVRDAPVVVLGAGLAGLAAARELRRNGLEVVVYEAGSHPGGMADTHVEDGITFDTGAHFITNRLAAATGIGHRCRTVRRYGETVWLDGHTYGYPLGLVRVPRFARAAAAARLRPSAEPAASAAERLRGEYGTALADEVAVPLLEAWSGTAAAKLSPAVVDKIPGGVAATIALKLSAGITRRAVAIGYCREAPQSTNVWHVYPEGGIATVCDHLAAELSDHVVLESPVERILVQDGRAVGVRVAGRDVAAAAVVSTLPANRLPDLADEPALEPLRALRFRPMVFVNLWLRGRDVLPDTMVWTPAAELPFFRLTETPRSMPWLVPAGTTLVTADIGAELGDPTWGADDEELGERCLDALGTIVPQARRDHLGARVVRSALAYPVFHLDYEDARLSFAESTGVRRLLSVGRNGEFAHLLMEDLYWRTVRKTRALVAELRAG